MKEQVDYSQWFTKQQTAAMLNVSTKQVERWAHAGQLQSAKWKRPEGGPVLVVYHPGDVERLARERNPDAQPFVLPANGMKAIVRREPYAAQLLEALRTISQTSQTRIPQLYFTRGQAAEYSGLGIGYLRRQIEAGKLRLMKGAGRHGADMIRRADLEGL